MPKSGCPPPAMSGNRPPVAFAAMSDEVANLPKTGATKGPVPKIKIEAVKIVNAPLSVEQSFGADAQICINHALIIARIATNLERCVAPSCQYPQKTCSF